jgi:tRNA threonylcarbamoyladenosine biosynthesis protein TsaB
MIACAIETSGALGSVALADEDRILAEVTFERGLRHGQAVIPAIARCLEDARLSKGAIDLYVAGTGPGSYTGMRVGLATAKALAFALRKPLIGVPSFDALAVAVPAEALRDARSLLVATDARRDRLYAAVYDAQSRAPSAPPSVRRIERLLDGIEGPLVIAGYALDAYATALAGHRILAADAHARDVARLGLARYRTQAPTSLHVVEPLYLREGLSAD